eukprot:11310594-Ditylum_brightwellii.AAC.1
MDCDLLTMKSSWLKKFNDAKQIIDEAFSSHAMERTSDWSTHWDHQFYKALESSYQMGLENILDRAGDMRCEIIVEDSFLAFRPPLPALKSTYFAKVKSFMEFPGSKFKGLNNS